MRQTVFSRRPFLVPLAVVILALALAALLKLFGGGEPAPFAPSTPHLDHLTLAGEPHFDDLDGITERRVVRALVVRSRTFYFFDGAAQRGLAYEMLKAFEEFLNDKLNTGALKISVVFVPVVRDQLLPALTAGYGDLAVANLTITPARREQVDFSIPVWRNVSEILVTGPTAPAIASAQDLSGKTVHARASSSYYESLAALNERLQAQGKAPAEVTAVDEHIEDEGLLEMVQAGLVPAVVVDSHKAEFWAQILEDINLRKDIVLRTGADVAWALRKNSPKLKGIVNEFLAKNREGSLLGNLLFTRYLKETDHLANALQSSEVRKFRNTAHLFQRYASMYGFDWLMIMSQAYQESRLDNSLVSDAGAVGIMQLLPSTAADKNVNIADVGELENNIHAGNKYLRFIRDRYFEEEAMDDLNKTLFSFAAYNAGPARIASLRKAAAAQGLDPNAWFDNVEVLAAQRVGREPVDYVRNIYKYWIAYRLSRAQLDAAVNPPTAA